MGHSVPPSGHAEALPSDAAVEIDLERFTAAQRGTFEHAKHELSAGRKRGCWIWYIFPQTLTNRFSQNCKRYEIRSLAEANAYLDHPVLGPRLVELVEIVLQHSDSPIEDIMGWEVDAEKFRSCCTLFALVSPPGSVFQQAIDTFFKGKGCEITVQKMGRQTA
jgi:uncharacterized protein (DUF1810 family)